MAFQRFEWHCEISFSFSFSFVFCQRYFAKLEQRPFIIYLFHLFIYFYWHHQFRIWCHKIRPHCGSSNTCTYSIESFMFIISALDKTVFERQFMESALNRFQLGIAKWCFFMLYEYYLRRNWIELLEDVNSAKLFTWKTSARFVCCLSVWLQSKLSEPIQFNQIKRSKRISFRMMASECWWRTDASFVKWNEIGQLQNHKQSQSRPRLTHRFAIFIWQIFAWHNAFLSHEECRQIRLLTHELLNRPSSELNMSNTNANISGW